LTRQLSSFLIQLIIIQILIEETSLDKELFANLPGEDLRKDPSKMDFQIDFGKGKSDGQCSA